MQRERPTGRERTADPITTTVEGAAASVTRWVHAPLSALSFWSAIALPVLYLPVFAGGVETTAGLVAFLGLVALHVLALIGGRGYRRTPE